LKTRELEFILVEDFLAKLKKEFNRGYNKSIKITELEKIEQKLKTIEKFVQGFRKAAKGS